MKRSASFLILLGMVLGTGCNNDPRLEVPGIPASAIPSEPGDYAGSDTCRTCHQSIWQTWSHSRHTKKVRNATLDVLVNDFDDSGTNDFVKGGAGITFDVATSVPADQTSFPDLELGPGVEYPKLGWVGGVPVVRIGPNTYEVTYVLGGTGKWKQRYMVTIDNQEYISPVQFNDVTREYVWYHPEHWYTLNAAGDTLTGYLYGVGQTPITEGKVRNGWQRRCIGCHVTGVRDITKNADGEYGASIADMENSAEGPYFSEMPVACEACHGPSARHVELGGGIGTTINPATMAADRGDEVCGSCHTRGTSTNAEGFGYPWKEGALVEGQYRPGDDVDDFYTHVTRDSTRFWGDGGRSAKSHHQQWIEHKDTPHGRAGVTCWKCHDPHGSNIDADLKMPVQELCLSCHDGKGDIDADNLQLHTRHTSPEAQNCRYCHFVQTAKSGIPGDISSHTYRVIYPSESEETEGLPNSCGECHQDRSIDQLNTMLMARFPDARPVAFATAGLSRGGPLYKLDGGQSFDPLGGPIAYQWSILNGPGASFSQSQLIAATGEEAIFVPGAPGKYTFRLVVTNVDGVVSAPAQAMVDVPASVVQMPPDLRDANYMGSTTCKICHSDIHSEWEVTRHPLKVRRPNDGPGVVFVDTDEDGENDWFQGDFNVRDSALPQNTTWGDLDFDGFSAPILNYDAGTKKYFITIGDITYEVTWVLGGTGKWKQRYMVTIGKNEYISPVQYNEETKQWVPYHIEDWYFLDGDEITGYVYNDNDGEIETPVTEGNTDDSWQRRCITCHATGMREMTQDPVTKEYADTIAAMLAAASGPRLAEAGIGCEACHGPGSFHVDSPSTNGTIINPSKLSTIRANEACGQCHNRGSSVHVNDGVRFGFPWGASTLDGHYIPGEDLDDFYTPKAENSTSFWPDPYGHSKQHHQQWLDLRWTGHVKSGMTCATCHSSHVDIRAGQLRLPANQLCKSCHPDKVDDQGAMNNHSRHPNGSPANVCSSCHYPYVAKSAIEWDISAHSAQIIYPVTSAAMIDPEDEEGSNPIPNSCMTAGCHSKQSGQPFGWDLKSLEDNAEATKAINWMWGDIAPVSIARVFDGGGGRSVRQATFTAPVTVKLDGARSYDPNGGRITSWAWTILSAPSTSSAFLKTRLVAQPTIDISVPGTYTFSLVARDALKSGKPQTVTIEVK
ncbi:MAG: ammonia-forming cytochrome c nitrite reductase subunit c552 [Planctomycetota bacterium]|jgi:predicted CXXCH cytochrome family protein